MGERSVGEVSGDGVPEGEEGGVEGGRQVDTFSPQGISLTSILLCRSTGNACRGSQGVGQRSVEEVLKRGRVIRSALGLVKWAATPKPLHSRPHQRSATSSRSRPRGVLARAVMQEMGQMAALRQ